VLALLWLYGSGVPLVSLQGICSRSADLRRILSIVVNWFEELKRRMDSN